MATAATPRVGIIGAGMSGLCMAMKLQAAGIDSFVIYEQADEVGGTWRDHTYPGLHCDIPSPFYSYSFFPNAEWSRMMPPGGEIQQYLRRVADERGIRRHIRFGTEVTAARYDDGRWLLTSDAGDDECEVLITATGFLRAPRMADIPGRDSFAGPMFHSARWDHSITLADKRIGLIVTGSTGVQIVAEFGGIVKQLKVLQRTAQWIYPFPNLRFTRIRREMIRRFPASARPGYVFTDLIDHIDPRGVVTADGTLHEVDVLVFATGFDARAYVRPMTIVGESGQTLDEVWADRPHAYRSIAVPGFPNLFMLMGPHSPIANQSLVPVAEDQADYAMWWIEQIRAGRVASAAPTEAATTSYNEDIKAALPETIWASGCNSWYIGKDGLPEVFPWHPGRHRELLRGPVVADFEVRTF